MRARPDHWWTAQLLKLGEDAAAFERIEQIPARRNALVQRAHDLVSLVRNGDPDAREELEIVLEILSNRQDQPKPQKQPRGSRKATLASALRQAAKANVPVSAAVIGADGITLRFGESEPTEAGNPWLDDLNKVTKQ
jgi:hypothetical protein